MPIWTAPTVLMFMLNTSADNGMPLSYLTVQPRGYSDVKHFFDDQLPDLNPTQLLSLALDLCPEICLGPGEHSSVCSHLTAFQRDGAGIDSGGTTSFESRFSPRAEQELIVGREEKLPLCVHLLEEIAPMPL